LKDENGERCEQKKPAECAPKLGKEVRPEKKLVKGERKEEKFVQERNLASISVHRGGPLLLNAFPAGEAGKGGGWRGNIISLDRDRGETGCVSNKVPGVRQCFDGPPLNTYEQFFPKRANRKREEKRGKGNVSPRR